MTCSGVASTCFIGLLNGKMIGAVQCVATAFMISWVNKPETPETPMSTVGFA
jgi:hypothetical protein